LKHEDTEQKLTHKESELLRLLCLHENAVLERDVALKLIWSNDSFFNARSMDVYITKLRKYLSYDPKIEIVNIHGRGFKLTVA
jgi:DNA-binding response OmpR family regulator